MKKKPIQIIIYSLIVISICTLFINFFLNNTYKDDIGQTLKNKINSTTNLKTNYKNISLSIWEHFPYISINIDDYYFLILYKIQKMTQLYILQKHLLILILLIY